MDSGLKFFRTILPDAFTENTASASNSDVRGTIDRFTKQLTENGYDASKAQEIAIGCARRADRRNSK